MVAGTAKFLKVLTLFLLSHHFQSRGRGGLHFSRTFKKAGHLGHEDELLKWVILHEKQSSPV